MPTTTGGEEQPLSPAPLQNHSARGCLLLWEVSHCPQGSAGPREGGLQVTPKVR